MIEITESPIDLNQVLSSVIHPACGAEVLFVGTTRQWTEHPDHAQPVETEFLIYETYAAMALNQMQRLEEQAKSKWPVRLVSIVHRTGKVLPTEPSVAVAVSSPHRSEAFAAAKWLIDTLKHDVPIWKQEHYVQSGAEWIHPSSGNCNCPTHTTAAPESDVVVASPRTTVDRAQHP
ncbi:MAG: molybdenum cofactor biosynthesis protein MoaE [Planctomycetales bacterium]|nr:molybdenum cofactor biosynthesis protein MoaE [Planctomycetales bacterium]